MMDLGGSFVAEGKWFSMWGKKVESWRHRFLFALEIEDALDLSRSLI
jgi:hypothetical protein